MMSSSNFTLPPQQHPQQAIGGPIVRSGRSRTSQVATGGTIPESIEESSAWTPPPPLSPRFAGHHHQTTQLQQHQLSSSTAPYNISTGPLAIVGTSGLTAMPRPDMSEEILTLLETLPVLHCSIDFAKPDGLRTRALIIENRRLYICEYYMSIWSVVFRTEFFASGQRDDKQALAVPNARYNHMLELLECMYPQHKPITEHNIQRVLPLAYEYQIEEIQKRCVDFLKHAPMKHMDKIVMADRFHLDNLLIYCLQQVRVSGQLDFYSNQYERLSDRTKVQLLEKLHQIKADVTGRLESIPEVEHEDTAAVVTSRLAKFSQKSEIYFSVLRSKSGRHYYCNPYYLAAWSRVLAEDVLSFNRLELDCATLTDEEAANFLLAVHPPQMKLNDANIGSILRASCKLEAPGLIRRCVAFLLSPISSLDVFEKITLLDRCFLHELLEPCLRSCVYDVNEALRLSTYPPYEMLSSRAKAAILDKIANLLQTTSQEPIHSAITGISGQDIRLSPHFCLKCRKRSACYNVKWLCPQCGSYCADGTN